MNLKKICTIIILVIILINTMFSIKCYAISTIISDGDGFLSASDGESDTIDTTQLGKTNTSIYNILLGIGITIAVVVGAVLGIQFIFQSAEGKAKISEALIPYIVGCFVVFGAFGIWKIAINAGKSITNQTGGGGSSTNATKYGIVICPECGAETTLDSAKYGILEKNKQITLSCGHKHGYSDGVQIKN